MKRKLIYFDLDGVMCDFVKMRTTKLLENPQMPYPQVQIEFWTELEPIEGALEAYERLSQNFDVGILTAPSIYNSASYSGKQIWVAKHLGMEAVKNMIIAYKKERVIGDYLIDDGSFNGQDKFKGELIVYNTEQKGRGEWERIVNYIEKKEKSF